MGPTNVVIVSPASLDTREQVSHHGCRMCLFSGPVDLIGGTKIFARSLGGDRQALVYQMSYFADQDLAMVLPLPTPIGSRESAIEFVNLEKFPTFFDHLREGFPAFSRGPMLSITQSAPKLKVQQVGDFEASFVPTQGDFARLDPRFRLADLVWDQMPQYADWGFAVFKLRKREKRRTWWPKWITKGGRGITVHPMAFLFPTRRPQSLFFPTVHIHDGLVHETATFDHTLYCQPNRAVASTFSWRASTKPARKLIDISHCGPLVDGDARVFRKTIYGKAPNTDQWLTAPVVRDLARLIHRSERCEIHFRARHHYYSPYAGESEQFTRRRETASKQIDRVIDQLVPSVESTLAEESHEQWDTIPWDGSLPVFSFTAQGELRSTWAGSDGLPILAPNGEPLVIAFAVASLHVEQQEIRVAFSSPPELGHLNAIRTKFATLLDSIELSDS